MSGLHVFSGQGINLCDRASLDRLEQLLIQIGEPCVVIFDTVQQIFGVDDANDATQVGAVYAELFRLRNRFGTTFILIHHRKKGDGQNAITPSLDMVRDSSAHGTQCSTVWFLTPAGTDALDIRQIKRRGADRTSLRVHYHVDEADRITLEGAGPIEESEGQGDRAAEWLMGYLTDRKRARTGELHKAAKPAGIAGRTVDRALQHLLKLGVIRNPSRGLWTTVESSRQEEVPL
jgi:hypothetical protein